jgi:ubiquinone/menaquinone biosynthesis C-methylase UbiE
MAAAVVADLAVDDTTPNATESLFMTVLPVHDLVLEVMTAYDVLAGVYDDICRAEAESRIHATWLIETLHDLGAKTVLDAAAGTGEQAIHLWRSGEFSVVIANDLNGSMLERCKAKLPGAGIAYRIGWPADASTPLFGVTQQDWTSLDRDLPTGSFDAVLCLGHAFFHLLTTERFLDALRCWNRMLRPGGYVLLDYHAEFAEKARQIRAGSFIPSPWAWKVSEITGRSGRRYLRARGSEDRALPQSPLGWRTWQTWLMSELTPGRHATELLPLLGGDTTPDEQKVREMMRVSGFTDIRTLSTGGAMLDAEAVRELAQATGFASMDVREPAPHMASPSHDALLRKPS